MKVLLINPEWIVKSKKNMWSRVASCYPSLGMAYIAAVLEKAGHQVTYLDMAALRMTLDDFKKNHLKTITMFELVGITATSPLINKALMLAKVIKERDPSIVLSIGGVHPTIMPDEVIQDSNVDIVVRGEGEYTFRDIANGMKMEDILGITYKNGKDVCSNPDRPLIKNLDELPIPAYHLLPIKKYNPPVGGYKRLPAMSIFATRGCPGRCLEGSTLINTVEGKIPIKNLIGKKVGILTYNNKTKEVEIHNPRIIKRVGFEKLVRVNFDNGTYIDCTPNHKFYHFTNGNQFEPTKERSIKAIELKPKMSVRAIRYEINKGYRNIYWRRRKFKQEHRLVMEYVLGRRLTKQEWIHHIDKNSINNLSDNLEVVTPKEHSSRHPEIAERMRNDNPQKYCTKESYEKVKVKITGIKRSMESRLKYRESKLGENNPNWKGGISGRVNKKSRIKEVNHKVVSVEVIESGHVYDIEMHGTHCYYANDVLVHNCTFCCRIFKSSIRARSAKKIVEEIKVLQKDYGIKEINFYDDTFTAIKSNVRDFCNIIIEEKIDITWSCFTRVNYIDKDLFILMKKAGCHLVLFGVESGNQELLDRMNKGITLDQIRKAVAICKTIGLTTRASYIFGTPGETEETIKQTIRFALELDTTYAQFNIMTAYPGTALWQEAKEKGWLIIKNYDYAMSDITMQLPTISNEKLQEMYKYAHRKYYLRPKMIWRHLMECKNPTILKEKILGALAVVFTR